MLCVLLPVRKISGDNEYDIIKCILPILHSIVAKFLVEIRKKATHIYASISETVGQASESIVAILPAGARIR